MRSEPMVPPTLWGSGCSGAGLPASLGKPYTITLPWDLWQEN